MMRNAGKVTSGIQMSKCSTKYIPVYELCNLDSSERCSQNYKILLLFRKKNDIF